MGRCFAAASARGASTMARILRGVVHYIDQNPVAARIAHDGAVYPFGSAWHYARPSGPPWLARGVIEGIVRDRCAAPRYEPGLYPGVFGRELTERIGWLMERRLLCRTRRQLVDTDLLAQAPQAVRDWMKRQARLADGTRPGEAVTSPTALQGALDRIAAERGDWSIRLRYEKPALPTLTVGLLRAACGLTLSEIGVRMNMARATVFKLVASHARLLAHDQDYASVAAQCLLASAGAQARLPEQK